MGGSLVDLNQAMKFNDALDDCHLLDLGFSTYKYIWTNRRKEPFNI